MEGERAATRLSVVDGRVASVENIDARRQGVLGTAASPATGLPGLGSKVVEVAEDVQRLSKVWGKKAVDINLKSCGEGSCLAHRRWSSTLDARYDQVIHLCLLGQLRLSPAALQSGDSKPSQFLRVPRCQNYLLTLRLAALDRRFLDRRSARLAA